jgi:hypothetical protein
MKTKHVCFTVTHSWAMSVQSTQPHGTEDLPWASRRAVKTPVPLAK